MKTYLQIFITLLIIIFNSNVSAQYSWFQLTNPLGFGDDAMIGQIKFVSNAEGWISCYDGQLLHTTDGGGMWEIINPFPSDTVERFCDPAINMSWIGNSHGWVIGTLGSLGTPRGSVIYYTTNYGQGWQRKVLSTETGNVGVQVQFINQNIGWVVLFNFNTGMPTFLKSTDGGNTWAPIDGRGMFYYANQNNGWAFGGEGTNGQEPPYSIHNTTNGGINWNLQFEDSTGGKYNAIYFSDINNGWIVGDSGKVLKTTDGGNNWTFVTNSGVNPAEQCKTVFSLNGNHVWIPTKDSDSYHTPIIKYSSDGGANWETQITPFRDSGGNNAVFSIFFTDEYNGYCTGDWGRIAWYTDPISVDDETNPVPDFYLLQNYPNPFNPMTNLRYAINSRQYVTLKVYNLLGKEVATLVNGYKETGSYTVNFDASNLSSGVYIYKLQAGDFTQTRKMTLVK